MADLTIGEIGKVLQLSLVNVDQTQSPQVQSPLDLTNASSINLLFVITDSQGKPKSPVVTKPMVVVGSPVNGVVQYTFAAGDLIIVPELNKNGVFRYSVQVNYIGGNILYPAQDGQLTIKSDATL